MCYSSHFLTTSAGFRRNRYYSLLTLKLVPCAQIRSLPTYVLDRILLSGQLVDVMSFFVDYCFLTLLGIVKRIGICAAIHPSRDIFKYHQ